MDLKVDPNGHNATSIFYLSPAVLPEIIAQVETAYSRCFDRPAAPLGTLLAATVKACKNEQELAGAITAVVSSYIIDALKQGRLKIKDLTPDVPSES
jgi:hypothetical protein